MFPPSQGIDLDVTAISGICGSISIVCWVVVFSPQIWENFTRSSADGLSLQFIIVWLAGDVFNILGAVLQGVLPTMIILAVYYTLADIVLLLQCFYYRGFTWRDEVIPPKPITNSSIGEATERTGLLAPPTNARSRRSSAWSESVDASHLSPVTPLLDTPPKVLTPPKPRKRLPPGLSYVFAILSVTAAGVLAWWISNRWQSGPGHHHSEPETPREQEPLQFSLWGQIFGWFCAVLYLGSRVPQILLNYRRKSCEGVSMLFFLFACFGNLTYVLSIFAYDPTLLCSGLDAKCLSGEAEKIYGRYILVNASWLAGSMGTLFLDASIFVQFFLYRTQGEAIEDEEEDVAAAPPPRSRDERPLLQRGDSEYP